MNNKQPFIYIVNNQIVTNIIQGFNNSGYGHISINTGNDIFTITLLGKYNIIIQGARFKITAVRLKTVIALIDEVHVCIN